MILPYYREKPSKEIVVVALLINISITLTNKELSDFVWKMILSVLPLLAREFNSGQNSQFSLPDT